jgi:hypothetical protein
MSEIPFVTALGNALDAAISAPAQRRFHVPRRRLTLVAVALIVLATGGLAAAHFLAGPEKLASNSVGCYDRASLDADVSVPNGVASPLEACAAVYRAEGQPVPPLVACAGKGAVAVFPGQGDAVCRRLGLAPLPPGYALARQRVATLQTGILALEGAADCTPPPQLAQRVQALLDSSGWTGWRTRLRLDRSSGPCGSVSGLGGDGRRSIAGSLDADRRLVMVVGAPNRSTERLMYGPNGLAPRIEDVSGTRCLSLDGMKAEAAALAAPSGRDVSFNLTTGRPANEEFGDAREQRYQAGCTVATDVTAAPDGRGLVVTLLRRR